MLAAALPSLLPEIWAHVMDLLDAERHRAARSIQARFRGYLVRCVHCACALCVPRAVARLLTISDGGDE